MTLKTGIDTFDRKLGGGVPKGSLIAVLVPPGIQHDPLLCAGSHQRESLFFTTIKNETAVRKTFDRSPREAKIEEIVELDSDAAADVVPDRVSDMGETADFYVDVVDPIEERMSAGEYVDLLNTLTEQLDNSGNIGYVYGYDADDTPVNRRYTLDLADFVIELGSVRKRSKLIYYLKIPKANGVELPGPDRFLEIEVGRTVDIDETRNI